MLRNVRHESFAQAFAVCGNASEAWRQAGGKGWNANVVGSRWLAKVDIAARIAEIRGEMEQGFKMTREQWLQRLKDNADSCKAAKDRSAERQALREIGLAMPAWYPAGRQEIAVETVPRGPSLEELLSDPATVESLARVLGKSEIGRAAMRAMLEKFAA